jgi:serine/threonine protein kinase
MNTATARRPLCPRPSVSSRLTPKELAGRDIGPYRLEREIGRGGMSVVMAARHRLTHEEVAVKLLLPARAAERVSVIRLAREARLAGKLKSAHAVPVLAAGEGRGGVPFIAMPLLEGEDLASIVRTQKHVPVARAVELIAQACDAVGEAHALGVVHRDLKLGNLFLAHDGKGGSVLKVLDFGIAKPPPGRVDETATSLTEAGCVLGTPHYMAPEQLDSGVAVGPTTDVWALGVCLYRLVTDAFPFDGPHPLAVYTAILTEPFASVRSLRPEVPVEIERIITRCLQAAPGARFADARVLGRALTDALSDLASVKLAATQEMATAPKRPSAPSLAFLERTLEMPFRPALPVLR